MATPAPDLTIPDPEPLSPELLACVDWQGWIRHPYVNAPHDSEISAINAVFNQKYRSLTKSVARAKAERQWFSYLILHEAPYRLDALLEIEVELADSEYWQLLGGVWMHTNYPSNDKPAWRRAWSKRAGPEQAMDEQEQVAFDSLPDLLTTTEAAAPRPVCMVYHGHSMRMLLAGSLSYGAVTPGPIWRRRVSRSGIVLAHFIGRKEAEIVVFPNRLRDLTFEKVAKLNVEERRVLNELAFGPDE
jgi:hypothetical protein